MLVSVERAAISHVLREFRTPFSLHFLHLFTLSLMIFALLIAVAGPASTTPTLPKTPAQCAPLTRTLPARAPRPTPTALILLLMCRRSVAVSVNSEIVVNARLAQLIRQARKSLTSLRIAEQTLATPAVVRPSYRVRRAPSRTVCSRRTSAPSALRGSSCLVVQRHV